MRQPFDSITRIGEWCQAKNVDWAIAGSWGLLLQGVCLPQPPHDLDVPIGLSDLTEFYAENPWIRQRAGESVGRSIVLDDLYTIDLLPTVNEFQQGTLDRARPVSWGGLTVRLTDPTDVMLYKLDHLVWDERGAATCKAIVDWRYAQKKNRSEDYLNLAGGDTGRYWAGPVQIYNRETK